MDSSRRLSTSRMKSGDGSLRLTKIARDPFGKRWIPSRTAVSTGEPGIAFFGAGTTVEADEILRREAIDLILLDLALPGEDGLSFCKRIKAQERYRAIPVIAFSAFPRQIYESRAREVGCIDYFDKPFHPRDLIAAVRKHLTAAG